MFSIIRTGMVAVGSVMLLSLAACSGSGDGVPPDVRVEVSPGTRIPVGDTAAIAIHASGKDLEFEWKAERGKLSSTSAPSVVYRAESPAGKDIVTVKVTGAGGSTTRATVFEVVEAASTPSGGPQPSGKSGVTLTNLENGDTVPCQVIARGKYSVDGVGTIWPVVYVGGRYHPQDEGGKAPTMLNGEWSGTVRFGNCDEPEESSGTAFQLLVVSADQKANAAFESYLQRAKKVGSYPGLDSLPDVTTAHVRILVTRQ